MFGVGQKEPFYDILKGENIFVATTALVAVFAILKVKAQVFATGWHACFEKKDLCTTSSRCFGFPFLLKDRWDER